MDEAIFDRIDASFSLKEYKAAKLIIEAAQKDAFVNFTDISQNTKEQGVTETISKATFCLVLKILTIIGIVESFSLGAKGTHIVITNPAAADKILNLRR